MKPNKLSDYSKDKVIELFNNYMAMNFPEKLKFNPQIIEYNDEFVKFGMLKHYGILSVNSQDFADSILRKKK